MFLWAPIPDRHRELGSLEFSLLLARSAHVAVSPGIGFGAGGDGHVRFALVENEQRIVQATRAIRRLLET
jgi:alanine-synthesizing transaminase